MPRRFLAWLIPVSYTHLDVYKRQVYHHAKNRVDQELRVEHLLPLDPEMIAMAHGPRKNETCLLYTSPGALTIVVKAAPCVPTFMRAADDTVALRASASPVVQALIRACLLYTSRCV